jgi:hypothetical protein
MINKWITGLLGLVVAGAVFLNLSETTLTWVLVVSGIVIAIISFWDVLYESQESGSSSRGSHA